MQQRHIKFRAWDGEKLISPAYIMPPEFSQGDWIFEQFTGLLDETGAEIYEGDILHRKTKTFFDDPWRDEYAVVEFFEGEFVGRTSANEEHPTGLKWFLRVLTPHLVVGNIHENPDLLESPDKIFFPPQGSVSLHEDEDNELYDPAKDPTVDREEEPMPF